MRIAHDPPEEGFPINITNMIDVFLMLLIFFLVATTLRGKSVIAGCNYRARHRCGRSPRTARSGHQYYAEWQREYFGKYCQQHRFGRHVDAGGQGGSGPQCVNPGG